MLSKQKYSRAAKDQSQLQQFVDEVCEESKRLLPEIKSGDAHKVLKVKADRSGTEYDFVDISELTANGECPDAIKELIESLGGTTLREGDYIYDADKDSFVWVAEIPEDYVGTFIMFSNDSSEIFEVGFVDENSNYKYLTLTLSGIEIYNDITEEQVIYSINGASKLNFSQLTHSFNELDPTLKALCKSAILAGSTGVACTQAQWNVIKSLLDKSLYFNYEGTSMIKTYSTGIGTYAFGGVSLVEGQVDHGFSLYFYYNADDEVLQIIYSEL